MIYIGSAAAGFLVVFASAFSLIAQGQTRSPSLVPVVADEGSDNSQPHDTPSTSACFSASDDVWHKDESTGDRGGALTLERGASR